jgi:cytochrome bd ubiquinol oxidase subunit I
MWALSWLGLLQRLRRRDYDDARWLLWAVALSFPSGFVAVLSGWFVAEIGRQPWVIYGLLRTADAHSPAVTAPQVLTSLSLYVIVYSVIFVSGAYYIVAILRRGPEQVTAPPAGLTPKRPMAIPGESPGGITHPAE